MNTIEGLVPNHNTDYMYKKRINQGFFENSIELFLRYKVLYKIM